MEDIIKTFTQACDNIITELQEKKPEFTGTIASMKRKVEWLRISQVEINERLKDSVKNLNIDEELHKKLNAIGAEKINQFIDINK